MMNGSPLWRVDLDTQIAIAAIVTLTIQLKRIARLYDAMIQS
ncbi:MAG: hypothetical protein ABIV36_24820 [Sphingobium limneticum]